VLLCRPMFRTRRWLAGALAVVFLAVEVFASAPQLHFHPEAGAQGAVDRGQTLATRSSGRRGPQNDCLACRTFSLATTLISWLGVTPPAETRTLTLVAAPVSPTSDFLDDARGRAPPAC
jgi:hypothetical protein